NRKPQMLVRKQDSVARSQISVARKARWLGADANSIVDHAWTSGSCIACDAGAASKREKVTMTPLAGPRRVSPNIHRTDPRCKGLGRNRIRLIQLDEKLWSTGSRWPGVSWLSIPGIPPHDGT